MEKCGPTYSIYGFIQNSAYLNIKKLSCFSYPLWNPLIKMLIYTFLYTLYTIHVLLYLSVYVPIYTNIYISKYTCVYASESFSFSLPCRTAHIEKSPREIAVCQDQTQILYILKKKIVHNMWAFRLCCIYLVDSAYITVCMSSTQ